VSAGYLWHAQQAEHSPHGRPAHSGQHVDWFTTTAYCQTRARGQPPQDLELTTSAALLVTGFIGVLVNSTDTVTELAARTRETGGRLTDVAYRGVLRSTAAMAGRNAVLVAIRAIGVLANSALPLVLILLASLAVSRRPRANSSGGEGAADIRLASRFSGRAHVRTAHPPP